MGEQFVTMSDISGRVGRWGVTNSQGNNYSSVYFPRYVLQMHRASAGKRGLSSQGRIFLNGRLDVTVRGSGSSKSRLSALSSEGGPPVRPKT